METSWMWTPLPLTTDINKEYSRSIPSLFDITFEDTVTVFKQNHLLKTLQIKLQKGLSCHCSPYNKSNWHTEEGHAESEDPSTIPCHWDTEWERRLSLLTQQLNTRSKGFILNYRHWNKQKELNWSLRKGSMSICVKFFPKL